MALSACPGCGTLTEHGEDACAFYEHVRTCPDVNDPKMRQTAVHQGEATSALDRLWVELRNIPAGVPVSMETKERMERVLSSPLDFDGAVRDYLNLSEDVHMQLFLKLLSMIPSIIGVVKQVEDTIQGQGQGPNKLNLVLNTINAAVAAVPEVQQSLAGHDLNGTVANIVEGTVKAMNAAKGVDFTQR